jgi:UDPglucose 6-dehydrogenase
MLKSSVGFGGSCFKKDVLNLVYLSESLHLPEVAAYWKAVVDINEWQKDRFAKRVVSTLYNTITNKRVAILGFAYKKNTGDTRESAAITIVQSLIAERAQISIYDPEVKEAQIWEDLGDSPTARKHVTICNNAYDACTEAHAVVILTEWDEFKVGEYANTDIITPVSSGPPSPVSMDGEETKEKIYVSGLNSSKSHADRPKLNWARVAKLMKKPMFVFDGRNIVDPHKLEDLGFRVQCIGNGRFGMKQ